MEFTEREQNLIELLADPMDKRSKEKKAVACGFSRKHVYRLQVKPGWRAAVYEQMKANLQGNLPRVYGYLLAQAKAGDTRASELILRASGEIQTGGGQNNVTVVKQAPEETLAARIDAVHAARMRPLTEPDGEHEHAEEWTPVPSPIKSKGKLPLPGEPEEN